MKFKLNEDYEFTKLDIPDNSVFLDGVLHVRLSNGQEGYIFSLLHYLSD